MKYKNNIAKHVMFCSNKRKKCFLNRLNVSFSYCNAMKKTYHGICKYREELFSFQMVSLNACAVDNRCVNLVLCK